jgi:stage V sporulation protein AC
LSNKKKKKLTPVQQEYHTFSKNRELKRPVFINCVKAFLVGGTICLIGQGVKDLFIWKFGFSEEAAGNPTVAVMIFLAVVLTALGRYDHISQWAGAGTAVPVTGFANAVASAAIEHRSEGLVLGVGGNMFKLAGPVIVFGVFSAFVIALIKTILKMLLAS